MKRLRHFFETAFFRFLVVGSTAAFVHYGVYFALFSVCNLNVAYSIGFIVAFIYNWLLTSYYTFRTKPSWKGLVGMSAAQGANYVIHISLLNLFTWLGVPEVIAPAPVYAIAVPISFLMMRFVFKKNN